jgi:hypothetical protein
MLLRALAAALLAAVTLGPASGPGFTPREVWAQERGPAWRPMSAGDEAPLVQRVDRQPLAAQARRVVEALDYIGSPIDAADRDALEVALRERADAESVLALQRVLDRYCLIDVHVNPESRVKVARGPARPLLVEQGWRTFLVKVRNEAGVTAVLRATSPQAGRVFTRGKDGFSIDPRPKQTLTARDVADRWLDLALFDKPPLTPELTGLELEYRIVQLYARDAGKREAMIRMDVGQGTQDIGFRNEAPILFTIEPSNDVTLRILDEKGRPTVAALVIRDAQGRAYPSPAKRLAPDFAFHPQVYRADGERLRLPAGRYTVEAARGPEYVTTRRQVSITSSAGQQIEIKLTRWIDLAAQGWYGGDHHIHAAGCLHYESPTEGVRPQDMIRHILGEALHVGAVLTWGPGYYFQKQFFEGRTNRLSTAEHLMRYDVEVSGFPSSHAGHLVLLRLKDQDYPGTTTLEDWPTWTLPILQWARAQGAVVGFAHSGWGLQIASTDLPSDEVPKFDGIGANEYIVDVAHDAVDFISTVDTPYPWELNIWYHTLNVGFRTRISGETDFPCIYGDRVGLGRSYVRLGTLDYDAWTEGIKRGEAYVTDGMSHLVDLRVNGVPLGTQGSEVRVSSPGTVRIEARVAARLEDTPNETVRGKRLDEQPYWHLERARIDGGREVPVEIVVNGRPVARRQIVADGQLRNVSVDVPIQRSSWIAMRILPSSHTNPMFVLLGGQPIRASRRSAEWCLNAVDRCWEQKSRQIAPAEREAAQKAYEHARTVYRQRLGESKTESR